MWLELSLDWAQALAKASLVSWPSALHTLRGHRDLRAVLCGKSHADTHEVNHLARGHPAGPLERPLGLSRLEVNQTLSAYAKDQPLGLPTAQPPLALVARWVHREFQKAPDRISRLRLENLIFLPKVPQVGLSISRETRLYFIAWLGWGGRKPKPIPAWGPACLGGSR